MGRIWLRRIAEGEQNSSVHWQFGQVRSGQFGMGRNGIFEPGEWNTVQRGFRSIHRGWKPVSCSV